LQFIQPGSSHINFHSIFSPFSLSHTHTAHIIGPLAIAPRQTSFNSQCKSCQVNNNNRRRRKSLRTSGGSHTNSMKLPSSSKASQMILLTGLLLILTISSNLSQPAVALKLPSFFAWMQPQPQTQTQSHSPAGSSNHAQVHSISSAAASTSVMGSGSSGSSGMADAEPMLSSASAFESANSAPPISGYPANSLRRPFQSMLLLPGRHHHSNQINLFSETRNKLLYLLNRLLLLLLLFGCGTTCLSDSRVAFRIPASAEKIGAR
jgi:hypothetical protein